MITRIQGRFEPDIYHGYKLVKGSRGRPIGDRIDGIELKTWGLRPEITATFYCPIVNGLEYGRFVNGKFVIDEEETLKAKKELFDISPAVFRSGASFVRRVIYGNRLDYEEMQEPEMEFNEIDFILGKNTAWRFRRWKLNDRKYSKTTLDKEIREGKIPWFAKRPTEEHQNKRPYNERNRSATRTGFENQIFRLVDLIQ